MTPQPRGIVPKVNTDRILAAIAARETADQELVDAVVDALKAGGSVREVAKVSGLANDTVTRWGHANGWPTAEQKKAREEARARNAAWRALGEADVDERAAALRRVADALDPDE